MHQVVKNIIADVNKNNKDKNELLEKLKEDIDFTKKILNGEYNYCKECDDYYLSKSFFSDTEDKAEKICTYSDPINSGGNEYKSCLVRYNYLVCPKGHKHILYRKELS